MIPVQIEISRLHGLWVLLKEVPCNVGLQPLTCQVTLFGYNTACSFILVHHSCVLYSCKVQRNKLLRWPTNRHAFHKENHQPDSLPHGHVMLWNVTYFTSQIRKNENHQTTAVFDYDFIWLWQHLIMATFDYGSIHYGEPITIQRRVPW